MPDRAILALQNVANYDSYVQTTNEYITNQILVKRGTETIFALDIETHSTTISHVTTENGDKNVAADLSSTTTGTEFENTTTRDLDYTLMGELRLINGTLYLQVSHHPEAESLVVTDPPSGWQIINVENPVTIDSLDTLALASWITFQTNHDHLVGRMGDWMLSHYPTVDALTSQTTETNIQNGSLEDGTPVDVIRFSGEGLASGLANSIPFIVNSPDGWAVLQAGIENPSITFTIDQHNQIRNRIISYNVIVENIDAGLLIEAEPNTRTSIIMTVNIVESYAKINATIQPADLPPISD
jgi:hypothetical protein